MVLGLIDGTLIVCQRTTGAEVARLHEHQGEVASLAFGPDGNILVSGDQNGTIKVWDSKDGDRWHCRKTLTAAWEGTYPWESLPAWEMSMLAVTPDGRFLAACVSGHRIAMWDLKDPDLPPVPGFAAGPGKLLQCLALSADGVSIAAGFRDPRAEYGVIVWDVATRRIVQAKLTPQFNRFAFSPDSRLLACGSFYGHFLLDPRTLQPVGEPVTTDGVHSITFSPDGQLLALATIFGKVSLRSVATNDEIASLNHPDSTGGVIGRRLCVAFSPDGQTLLAISGRTVLSWSLTTASERRVLYGNRSFVEGLAFSPDGKYLAIAHGEASGTLTLRDATTGQVLRPPRALPIAQWAEFSPDGTILATCAAGRLKLWGVPSLDELATPPIAGPAVNHCVAISSDGEHVAAASAEGLAIWRLVRGAPGGATGIRFALELIGQVPGRSMFLCFSPDGTRIAWANDFRSVKLWDVKRKCPKPFGGPNLLAGWQCLAFLPDGRHLAMITESRRAEVWDVEVGQVAFTLGEAGEFAKSQVAISPDGRWLAGDHTTGAVSVWDVERQRRLFVLPEEHGSISHLTWSPEGTRLAVGMKDGRVILWDLPQIRAHLAQLGLDW
jgi:WD40 repeat protein